MGIRITGDAFIWKSDKGLYSTTISNKNMDGTFDNAYITVQFKKGVELENKTKITINDGFITFYRNANDNNKPVFKLMVLDFSQEGDAKEESATDFSNELLPF